MWKQESTGIVSLADSTALFHVNVNETLSQQLVILVSNLQYKKLEIDITLLFIASIQKLIADRWTTLEKKPKKTELSFPLLGAWKTSHLSKCSWEFK